MGAEPPPPIVTRVRIKLWTLYNFRKIQIDSTVLTLNTCNEHQPSHPKFYNPRVNLYGKCTKIWIRRTSIINLTESKKLKQTLSILIFVNKSTKIYFLVLKSVS